VKLIIQIPCLNEEKTLPETLGDLPKSIKGIDIIEILVIDDGSNDRTAEVAREQGAHHVLSLTNNKGLAKAFYYGLNKALNLGADMVGTLLPCNFRGAVVTPVVYNQYFDDIYSFDGFR
jgi:glycosyltransferase involved in cell wall biosynthesis